MKRLTIVVPLLSALLASSCAYYNTFYHARQSYRQAEKARAEAPPQNRSTIGMDLYEQAMAKCAKVILEYSDSRWVDDAILLMGKCFYARADYLAALRKFDELLLYYADSNPAREARFWKAKTLVALERYDEAVPTLEGFREEKKDALGREALYLLALVEYRRENWASAAEDLESYIRHEKNADARDEVLRMLGTCYREMGDDEKALAVDRTRLEDPLLDEEARVETNLDVADLLVRRGRFDEAYRTLDEVLRGTASREDSLRVALHRGRGVLAEGKRDEAVELLRGALVDAPSSEAAGEIAFLLGGTYLEAYDNKDSAAAAFRKASSFPGPEEQRTIATDRAKHLGEYLDLKKELAAGTADTARVQFLLAEHDLFSFGEADSALVRYRLVSSRFPESGYAPRALAAEEYVAARGPGGAVLSDSLLVRLVRMYPKSPEAVEVLDRGAVRVDADSLALWTGRWVLAHPEPESTASDTTAISEEGEELPAGSEGELAASLDPGALDEGPPAPLRLEKRVEPAYPLIPEGAEKPEGFAEIQVDVAANGRVENARVVRSSEKAFEGPALAAAYQCRFVPETNSGTRETNLRFEFPPDPR